MTPIVEATVQAAALSALSNLLAQYIKSYTQQDSVRPSREEYKMV